MFDPFMPNQNDLTRRANAEHSHPTTIYYSNSESDDDSSGSSRSSRGAKYAPPHRKAGPQLRSQIGVRDVDGGAGGGASSSSSSGRARHGDLPFVYVPPAGMYNSPHIGIPLSAQSADLQQCPMYARTGTCSQGSLCPFQHDPSSPQSAKRFDPRAHPSYRTKPCYPFIFGECLKGDSCTFKHEMPPDGQMPPPSATPAGPQTSASDPSVIPEYRTKECKWFNSPGGCWYGDSCKFKHTPASELDPDDGQDTSHPFYRTRPCPQYMKGTCPKGDSCNYIHDPVLKRQVQRSAHSASSIQIPHTRSPPPNLVAPAGVTIRTSSLQSPQEAQIAMISPDLVHQQQQLYLARHGVSLSSAQARALLIQQSQSTLPSVRQNGHSRTGSLTSDSSLSGETLASPSGTRFTGFVPLGSAGGLPEARPRGSLGTPTSAHPSYGRTKFQFEDVLDDDGEDQENLRRQQRLPRSATALGHHSSKYDVYGRSDAARGMDVQMMEQRMRDMQLAAQVPVAPGMREPVYMPRTTRRKLEEGEDVIVYKGNSPPRLQ